MKEVKNQEEVTDKKEKLAEHVAHIKKMFGPGSIMRLGDAPLVEVEVIPSGSLALDECLGVGGVPRGRIVEIYGPESAGKTTMALHIVAEAQKLGDTVAFVDVEHALDPTYAHALGVNTDDLLMSQPSSGEQALTIVEELTKSGAVGVIVIDSVAALAPQAELDGEMADMQVGLQARLMSKACRKLTAMASDTGTTLIFINQIREKIGVMWGSPETTPGGRALKFYASVRLDVRKRKSIKNGDAFIGSETEVKTVKNKCAPPFRTAAMTIMYGRGINQPLDAFEAASRHGIITKSGGHYYLEGDKFCVGRENGIEILEQNPEQMERVVRAVRKKITEARGGPKLTAVPTGDAAQDDE